MTTCKNCNNHFEGNFCNNCGQSASIHKVDVRYIWQDVRQGLFYFENVLLYTIGQLITRPGKMTREFIEGKRVRHFKPFSFVVVLATAYGLLYHFTISQLFENRPIKKNDNLANAYLTVVRWTTDHLAISTLLLVLITTIASTVSFRKKGHDFAEHLVLNAYYWGLMMLVNIVAFPILYFYREAQIVKWYQFGLQAITLCLMYWCYSQFFNRVSKLKVLGLTFLTFVLSSAISLLIGYFAGWLISIVSQV